MKKHLPINISEFKQMIDGDYVYVDKTEILYELIQNKNYLLTRPRRFGKTVLHSTLEHLFLGNKELFKNTWIDASDYQWEQHPVIRLNFSALRYDNAHNFEASLTKMLLSTAQKQNIVLKQEPSAISTFNELMYELSKTNSVVILVDEYDYPLTANIMNIAVAQEIHHVILNFFAVIKAHEQRTRFCLVTGTLRFTLAGVFGGLNKFRDITTSAIATKLLGFTQDELGRFFADYVNRLGQAHRLALPETFEQLKTWYDGYRFSSESIRVYNPYSIIHALENKRFKNYSCTATPPKYVTALLSHPTKKLPDFKTMSYDGDAFRMFFDIDQIPLDLALFQSGYVTISRYEKELYYLDIPNHEVSIAFDTHIQAGTEKDEPAL